MPELPTGTVTFLFTDIEGSTQRWEQQTQAMQQALALHDAILREAVLSHRGAIVKTTGDGIHAAFSTAAEGVAAALAAQRALHAAAWGEAGVVRVRMALHTGTAEERDGDYFGPVLNRAARLMAAGHGGQILLSTATQELVRDGLPPGVELRDQGEHRLKDLVRSERIFQLVVSDLTATFPQLRTLEERPHNLPIQRDPLIGREQAVEAVVALLRRSQAGLVTLTGPGGTGKTRLALQVAAELLNDFPDGVWFVDLVPISDSGLVASTIATVLGVQEAGGRPVQDSLKAYLHDKQLLLLLDNFEQVVAAAPLLSALLQSAQELKVLVTSREVLRITGEQEYPVAPLALPDLQRHEPLDRLSQYAAVALFIVRAQAAKPDFQVTNESAPAVAEICVRLDGLPLAIELAAARVKVFPPPALLARLENRLRVLTGGGRDRTARQQTLRGAIDWSYNLLEPAEQRLFARMAVFAGGATIEAIEAVCDVDGDAELDLVEGVASLVDKSLLRQVQATAGESRLMMLETIHEYAWDRLTAQSEVELVRQRHATYFVDLAERGTEATGRSEEGTWLSRLETELPNFRVVLGWALDEQERIMATQLAGALGNLWMQRGYIEEGRQWYERILQQARQTNPALLARVLYWISGLAEEQGDYVTAEGFITECLTLYRELGDQQGVAAALLAVSRSALFRTDYEAAQQLAEESLTLARQFANKRRIARALRQLGLLATAQGDYTAAQQFQTDSIALSREIGDKWLTGVSLGELAVAVRSQGDYAAAQSYNSESLALLREVGDKIGVAESLNDAGWWAVQQGDYAQAVAWLEESLRLERETGRTTIVHILHSLALAVLGQGNLTQAQALLEEGLRLAQHYGQKFYIPEYVAAFAAMAGAQEHRRDAAQRTARLWGAAEAWWTIRGGHIAPAEHALYERLLGSIRATVSPATWAAAFDEGRAMTLEQAVAYALSDEA